MTSLVTMTAHERAQLPADLLTALREFPYTHPMMRVWRDYPMVTEAEDEATCEWADRQASELFVKFLAERGIPARLVLGECDQQHQDWDFLWWTRIDCPRGTVNVDWAARQLHNLEHPHNPVHADLPCPMVWMSPTRYPSGAHPVIGVFERVSDPAPADSPLGQAPVGAPPGAAGEQDTACVPLNPARPDSPDTPTKTECQP